MRCNCRPLPQEMSVALRGPAGGGRLAPDLAMPDPRNLVSGRIKHQVGLAFEQILGAPVVEEAVQTSKPEGDSPAGLRFAEDAKHLCERLIGTVVLLRIKRVHREIVISFVLDRENCCVLLPPVRLRTRVLSTVAS